MYQFKLRRAVPIFLALLFLLSSMTVLAVSEGTQGNELQVLEPEYLEIQLGGSWAGVEFILETDYGIYPGTIVVGNDGVLRLEIGGSETYRLTCLQSGAKTPENAQTLAIFTNHSDEELIDTQKEEQKAEPKSVAGIPIAHIAILGIGIIVAAAVLVFMKISSKSNQEKREDNFEDDEDD